MKWIAIGVGVLLFAGWLHTRRRSHHYEHWLDEDA